MVFAFMHILHILKEVIAVVRPALPKKAPLTTMERGRDFEARYLYSQEMEMTEYHCHDFYEIYLHLGGGQYFGLDDGLYLLKPNQVFIVPPFSMHGLSSDKALRQYERAYLNLSPEVLTILGCEQIDLDQFFRSYTAQGQNTFQLSPQEAQQCIAWIKELEQTASTEDPLTLFGQYATLINLLNLVCRGIRKSQTISSGVVSNSIIQKVLTYINSNYTQPLKIDQLAKQFGVSVSYLSHELARFTNRSVYDYVLYRRAMLACQMMQSDMSLNAIAYQCGFNDYSNFLRVFNKMLGTSPSKFRRKQRGFQRVK